jgi:hypothetical protein
LEVIPKFWDLTCGFGLVVASTKQVPKGSFNPIRFGQFIFENSSTLMSACLRIALNVPSGMSPG